MRFLSRVTGVAPRGIRLQLVSRSALPVAALLIVSLWRLWPAVATTPFHRDEARWIGNSAILREWRHPLGMRWQDEGYRNVYGTIDESNRRRSQPPLAMYLFGLGLVAQGEGLPRLGYWIMTEDTDWNSRQGNMPSPSQLRAARRTNVVVALLTVLAVYALGRGAFGPGAGLLAGLVYALHPLVRDTATRAFSDPLLVLCVCLAALAARHLARRPSFGRAALVGVFIGLGASTKLSPLLLAAGIGCLVPPLVVWSRVRRDRHMLRSSLLAATIPSAAIATFVVSYPYLWPDPIDHMRRMFAFRELSFDLQAGISPHARVAGVGDALGRFGAQLGERQSLAGVVLEVLGQQGRSGPWLWLRELDLVLACLGWVLILAWLVRNAFPRDALFPIAILAGQFALIAATFRLDYARYMLPLLPLIAVGIGAAFGLALEAAGTIMRAPARQASELKTPDSIVSGSQT